MRVSASLMVISLAWCVPRCSFIHLSGTTPASLSALSLCVGAGSVPSLSELQPQPPEHLCDLSAEDLPRKQWKMRLNKWSWSEIELSSFRSTHFFVALQRGQQTAANLTIRYFPPWPMNLWAKTQNWSTEQGLQLTPTTRATMLRAYLAREHSKNKWLTVSLSDKTWQVALPCHFLLNRLSLVKM